MIEDTSKKPNLYWKCAEIKPIIKTLFAEQNK